MTRPPPGTVFVIDDDEAVRDSLRLLLESHLFPVRVFASGLEFLNAIDACARGCVVLDLHLPVVGGLEFIGRYGDRLNDMPVILITGKADPGTRVRAFEVGVRYFLEKPFEDGELLTAVVEALRGSTLSDPSSP
jgi:two-component system response regulator FixJ